MKTGLFAVFDSQKSKDRTAGPVFSSLGPVFLRSFCGLETGLTNTRHLAAGAEAGTFITVVAAIRYSFLLS